MLRKKPIVRNIISFPYSVKESWDDDRPNWQNYQKQHDFLSYDTIYVLQENKTKRIVYIYPVHSLDFGKPSEKMYKHYEHEMLPRIKENEKCTDKYKIIGVDYDKASDVFMIYGDQFTVHFDMPGIQYHHPYNIYPYSMSIKDIGKKENHREKEAEEYWKPHNINEENLGGWPKINV